MERPEVEKWLTENRNIDGLAQTWHVDLLMDFQAAQNTIHNSNYAEILSYIKLQVPNDCGCLKKHVLISGIRKHFA